MTQSQLLIWIEEKSNIANELLAEAKASLQAFSNDNLTSIGIYREHSILAVDQVARIEGVLHILAELKRLTVPNEVS